MKNISTILSILALLLIATLFYLHFTHVEALKKVSVVAEKNAHTNFKIAYFDIDSLQEHYDYFKDVSGEMKKKESSMTAELNDLQAQYQKTVRKWQAKGNNITQQEGEAAPSASIKLPKEKARRLPIQDRHHLPRRKIRSRLL